MAARQAFARFDRRRQQSEGSGWVPVDLGGHEVIARLHMQLKSGAQAACEGRHCLDRLEGSIGEDQLGELRLLVTELVTNSVRHGAGDNSWITLDIEIYANNVRATVTDGGPGFDPPHTPLPHFDRPGGWGLCLIDRMADRWGVDRNGQTTVWFELDRGRYATTVG
jgi:anti-sigma regulatory factor (Ser/Thr protein kinase)